MSAMSPVNGVVQSKSAPDLTEAEEGKVVDRTRSLSFGDSLSRKIDQVQTQEELEQIKDTLVTPAFWEVVFSDKQGGEKLGTSYTSWSKSVPIEPELMRKIQCAQTKLKQPKTPTNLTFEKEPFDAYKDNSKKMVNS